MTQDDVKKLIIHRHGHPDLIALYEEGFLDLQTAFSITQHDARRLTPSYPRAAMQGYVEKHSTNQAAAVHERVKLFSGVLSRLK
jgi:hypothetical protein